MAPYAGERCRLRPLKREDAGKALAWRNDPDIRDMALGNRFPVTAEVDAQWFDAALTDKSNRRVVQAVEALSDGALVGMVTLRDIDWVARTTMFSIVIGEKAVQGKGIGTEATILTLGLAFEHFNLRKVSLVVAAFNATALHIYQKLGFREEGLLKEHAYHEGQFHDLIQMARFRE